MTLTTSNLNLDDSTILVSLAHERWGNKRTLRADDYDVAQDVEKAATGAHKVRLDSEPLRQIRRYDSETRRWLRARSLPGLLNPGVVRVPVALLDDAVAYLNGRAVGRAALVDEFKADYLAAVERTRVKLGHLFRPADYPKTAESAAAEFSMSWRIVASGVPEALAKLNAQAYEAEQAKYQQHLRDAAETYVGLLRLQFAELVAHLADRLAPKTDGTRKVLRKSTLGNIAEFIKTFPALNVANDAELDAVVKTADALLSGVEVDMLKDDEALRAAMAQSFAQMATGLDALVADVKPGARQVTLADDDDEV